MFHLSITKIPLIFFATYMHISYLDTLFSSHYLCALQLDAHSTMELKSFSWIYSPEVKARGILTPISFSCANMGFIDEIFGRYFQESGY